MCKRPLASDRRSSHRVWIQDRRHTLNSPFPGLPTPARPMTATPRSGRPRCPSRCSVPPPLYSPFSRSALGVLLAMWLLKRGPSRVIANLRSRIRLAQAAVGTSDQPGEAVVEFQRLSGGAGWAGLDLSADVTHKATEINSQINAIRKQKWFSLTSADPEVQQLSSQIKDVEGIGANLVSLAGALTALQNDIPVVEASKLIPTWTTGVQSRFQRLGVVTLTELDQLVAAAKEDAAVANWFPSVAQQVRAAEERMVQLEQDLAARPRDERTRIERAQGHLDVALAQFGRAVTSSDVRDAYKNEFNVARQAVDELASLEVIARAGVAGPALAQPRLLSVTLPTPEVLTREAQAIISEERVASLVAVLIVGAILLLAGLQALVIGKTFGTAWDFAAAIAWGSATLVVASPLATAIEGYRQVGSKQT